MDLIEKWLHKVKEFILKQYFQGHNVIDVPSSRDWLAKPIQPLLGKGGNKWDSLPDKVDLFDKALKVIEKEFKIDTQNALKMFPNQDGNECTAYSNIYGIKISQTIASDKYSALDEERHWQKMLSLGIASDKEGATLQASINTFTKNDQGKPIAAYYRLTNNRNIPKEDLLWNVLAQIARQRTLFTGNYWRGKNWNVLVDTGIYYNMEGAANGAHAICLCGFKKKEKLVQVIQALPNKFGDNEIRVYWIPFEELDGLMNIYAIIPYEYK